MLQAEDPGKSHCVQIGSTVFVHRADELLLCLRMVSHCTGLCLIALRKSAKIATRSNSAAGLLEITLCTNHQLAGDEAGQVQVKESLADCQVNFQQAIRIFEKPELKRLLWISHFGISIGWYKRHRRLFHRQLEIKLTM
jgi:hypothetical protein